MAYLIGGLGVHEHVAAAAFDGDDEDERERTGDQVHVARF